MLNLLTERSLMIKLRDKNDKLARWFFECVWGKWIGKENDAAK